MTKLPPPIEKLRDKLAADQSISNTSGPTDVLFSMGFDAGYASRDKEVERLVAGLASAQQYLQFILDEPWIPLKADQNKMLELVRLALTKIQETKAE